ncbi:MFS transporter [Burkholderia sp. Ac-20345]|uniref:MFS transporter n=1 Tax=Burkholderia sp. Ac-20345 TaxID=2703891 RepID=UPI00197C83EB|nr:MFS transporter [Burkholderia sp. Ac-20345]MBN3776649.1 MFS transporter [Burkholderia sp. Ac-20345]
MTRNTHAATPAPHNPWREICAASIGNALEFYDLLIYGYFAIVIGQLFFPTHDAATSLLLSVGTFGISFITRPLGSIVLGSYADRAGRKASLTMSIGLMMLGTAMIAFAPTYAQIGIASPLVIIVARMLQGFSTGGEFGAATAFMVEQADAKRRGFFASWQMSTQGLATVLAAGVSALLSLLLTTDQLHAWGWRVAFSVGLLIGPVGLYIRRNIDEPADFRRLGEKGRAKSPLRDVFARDRANLLLGAGVVATATAFNYVHKLYMPTYAVKQLHIPATSSYLGAVVTGAMLMVAAPVVGHLSDRFGRIRVMLIAVSLAPLPALLADIFPTSTRGTGLALSYNFSVTLFGGFAPLIVTWLIDATHNKLAPSFYVMATAVLGITSVISLGRRMRGAAAAATPSTRATEA